MSQLRETGRWSNWQGEEIGRRSCQSCCSIKQTNTRTASSARRWIKDRGKGSGAADGGTAPFNRDCCAVSERQAVERAESEARRSRRNKQRRRWVTRGQEHSTAGLPKAAKATRATLPASPHAPSRVASNRLLTPTRGDTTTVSLLQHYYPVLWCLLLLGLSILRLSALVSAPICASRCLHGPFPGKTIRTRMSITPAMGPIRIPRSLREITAGCLCR